MDERYKAYLQSYEWRELKIDLIYKRGAKCERCGVRKRPNMLHIHHLTYERIYKELPSDLQVLCAVCHMKAHGIYKPKKQSKHFKHSKKFKKKHKKKKSSMNVWQVVDKAKQGGYRNNKAILSAYKKATSRGKFR